MYVAPFLVAIILLFGIGGAVYLLYENAPGELEILHIVQPITPPVTISQVEQFYPAMRYAHDEITYGIERECDSAQEQHVKDALSILEDKTVLSFTKTTYANAELHVVCSEIAPEPETRNHFIAGEGGPTKIVNTTRYSLILNGAISFYREERCDTPLTALHEVLHALGFIHIDNKNSVLYPTLSCEQQFDEAIAKSINQLYADPSLPDLAITVKNIEKSGPYVSFVAEISNYGLIVSDKTTLRVSADEKQAQSYDIDALEPGVKSIITISNMKIPRGTTALDFEIDSNGIMSELDETNNKVATEP